MQTYSCKSLRGYIFDLRATLEPFLMGVNSWEKAKEQFGKWYDEFYVNFKSCKRTDINDFDQSNVINIIGSVSSEKTSNTPAK